MHTLFFLQQKKFNWTNSKFLIVVLRSQDQQTFVYGLYIDIFWNWVLFKFTWEVPYPSLNYICRCRWQYEFHFVNNWFSILFEILILLCTEFYWNTNNTVDPNHFCHIYCKITSQNITFFLHTVCILIKRWHLENICLVIP